MGKVFQMFYFLALVFVFLVAFFSFFSVFSLPGNYKVSFQKDGTLEIAKEIGPKQVDKEISLSQKTTILSLPIFGYFVLFSRKPIGFILLILVPCILAIIQEIKNIVEERKRTKGKSPSSKQKISFLSLFLFLIILLSFIGVSLIGAEENSSKTIFVDDDFEKDEPENYKWKSIQKAVENANSFDVIVVKEGIYEENIIIQKDNLTLVSEKGPQKTIIKAKDPLKNVLLIRGANNVKVKGFSFTGAQGTPSFRAFGIRVEPSPERGCFEVENCEILNNIITQNYHGIFLYRTKNCQVRQNHLFSNTGTNLWLYSSLYEMPAKNIFEENLIEGAEIGIFLWQSYGNLFSKNTIKETIFAIQPQYYYPYYYPWHHEEEFQNVFYPNNFIDNKRATYPLNWPVSQRWYSLEKFGYSFKGKNFANFLGNFWSDYQGEDENEDGIGDLPYRNPDEKYAKGDPYPLTSPFENYTISKKWSFAIITDLHIGRGYPDYDGEGYEPDPEKGWTDSQKEGEEYYLTQRLKNVVDWVIENQTKIDCSGEKCPIQFLVILGDIADSGEKSEFLKAKRILDKLNLYEIPYIPVFGNHDVWPFTEEKEAEGPLGENYFDEIFWNENDPNIKLLKRRFNWQKDTNNPNFKNFAFSYEGINFIGLDFNSRTHTPSPAWKTGVFADANLWEPTMDWFKDCLNEHKKCLKGYEGNKNIILSHIPFVENRKMAFSPGDFGPYGYIPGEFDEIEEIVKENKDKILANFGGHIHGFYDSPVWYHWEDANKEYPRVDTISIITTEALMVGGNEKDEYLKVHDKGVIKIVKILSENEIDYKTNEGKYNPETGEGKEFIALNPYISYAKAIVPEKIYPCITFNAHGFTRRDISYHWEFGNGVTSSEKFVPFHCYQEPKIYNVSLTLIDSSTKVKESITRKIEIEAEPLVPKVIKMTKENYEKVKMISQKLLGDLKEFTEKIAEKGANLILDFTDKITFKIKKTHSEPIDIPVGTITVQFEKAKEDIDFTNLIIDTDISKRKSILYMPSWPDIVEKQKILFIPKGK